MSFSKKVYRHPLSARQTRRFPFDLNIESVRLWLRQWMTMTTAAATAD